ncbi:nickel pincer cofactor biosynthesis protein LarC [Methanobrevibacter curvatus]|uniref:Putative nickel insertion protein n=1 Tax=Methanobrevibacter curvatus TaxID=49547 RepID=A0A165ZIM4_9EURY|nr:nickel pincer cofactor biosynthesis protein LarC [Methanobrevibacter curvatus]KZX10786.1 hypothetical protein MBCUR_16360 [Methanobrevibacter curvatus]
MVVVIDPQSAGISGNMFLGCLIDLGLDEKDLKSFIEYVCSFFGGVNIEINKINKKGIESTYVNIIPKDEAVNGISYLNFMEKIHLIEEEFDGLDNIEIFERAKNVFEKIALAESIVHGKELNEVHFHEVGTADAVADVFGVIYGFYELKLNKEKIIGLPISLGGGFKESLHGQIPIPSPATLEILNGVKCFGGSINKELATPTGSALYVELCDEFKDFYPLMKPLKTAYGAGTMNLDFPNVLRIVQASSSVDIEKLELIETNIDHVNGEAMGYLFNKLLDNGARDVFITPIIMKKNRPGSILSVIALSKDLDNLLSIIFNEIGTLGIRISPYTHRAIVERKILDLKIDLKDFFEISTNKNSIRNVKYKIGYIDNKVISQRPEYDDISSIANEFHIPYLIVEKKLLKYLEEFLSNEL